jgi:hypothetical protein
MAEDEFDIVGAFGAVPRGERFAAYVPNRDRTGAFIDQKAVG